MSFQTVISSDNAPKAIGPYPTRSCVQVAALPKGAKIEIEVMCTRGKLPYEQEDCNCHR